MSQVYKTVIISEIEFEFHNEPIKQHLQSRYLEDGYIKRDQLKPESDITGDHMMIENLYDVIVYQYMEHRGIDIIIVLD